MGFYLKSWQTFNKSWKKNNNLEGGKVSSHVCKNNGVFLGLCAGMGWKITMLALSSLALVIGIVILMLNVHSNR